MNFRKLFRSMGGTLLAVSLGTAAAADGPLMTNARQFRIPFELDNAPGRSPRGFAVLFGSPDGGNTWKQLQSVAAEQQYFEFTAPADGTYAFAVRMMDGQGVLQSAIAGSRPELEVVVDSTPPEIELRLIETSPGQVTVSWIVADPAIDLQTLNLEYREGQDGRWKTVSVTPAASGQAALQATPGTVVSARAAVSDQAGNQHDSTAQLVLRRSEAMSPVVIRPQAVKLSQQPLGPSPFASPPAANLPSPTSAPVSSTADVGPAVSDVTGVSAARGLTDLGQYADPGPMRHVAETPRTVAPAARSVESAALPDLTYGMPGEDKSAAAVSDLVNSRIFEISYQLEEVGPSGVGSVELFVTEDGGQQWFRYGADSDLQSPFQVDVQGEGSFGFAVRVRNGLGFADPPPQPGEPPTVVVTVDETPPAIEFPQPAVTPERGGAVDLRWRVSDRNPSSAPVRLESAASPAGPWSPVFEWQQDPGGYRWPVRTGTASTMYFRLLARDQAGNVVSAQPPQPVLIDMQRPVARGLRVQAVAASKAVGIQTP